MLEPTQIYVKQLLELVDSAIEVNGIAHITGGGLTENISRVIPEGLAINIDLSSWDRPEIFNWLQEKGNLSDSEMLRTFNCGIGMVVIINKDDSVECQELINSTGLKCWKIGSVRKSKSHKNDVEFI